MAKGRFGSISGLRRPLLGRDPRGSDGATHGHTSVTRGLAIAGK